MDAERSIPDAARGRYLTSAEAQAQAFRSGDLDDRVRWVAGEMAARTLATTRLSETWIHTVDIATALGVEVPPTDRLRHVARLVWRTVPYAMARAGASPTGDVAFELSGPSGDNWVFGDPDSAATVVRGPAFELCEVAGQRATVHATGTPRGRPGRRGRTWLRADLRLSRRSTNATPGCVGRPGSVHAPRNCGAHRYLRSMPERSSRSGPG